jgi:vanillate O-demethylase monooxygenase subunit
VWIGDAQAADAALLPDLWPCEADGWTFDGGVYHLKADYRLMIDNLMDLSHETYVHAGSIGQPEICDSPTEVTGEGDEVLVSRWMLGIDAPPFWRNALKRPGPVDRWQICRFIPPGTVMIDVGVAAAGSGAPAGDRSQGVNGYVIDLSPESERATWYFWGMARNFDIADRGFTDRFKAQQGAVFKEDLEILEAQQRSIEANPDLRPRNFNIDAGGARSRMVLERLLLSQGADRSGA